MDCTTSEAASESTPASMSGMSYGTLVPTASATREPTVVSIASVCTIAAGDCCTELSFLEATHHVSLT